MGSRNSFPDDGRYPRLPGIMGMIAAGAVILLVKLSVAAGDSTASVLVEPETEPAAALFNTYCLLCHGPDGSGVAGLGVSLVDSSFVQSQPEADLAEFLMIGRLPNDPASVSGRPMPGFAWMDVTELSSLAAYIKTLNRGQAIN